MAATASDPISLSSSGYTDGLGRRALEVDRQSGEMIERLTVRPELIAYEPVISARVARGSTLNDERLARPREVAWNDEGHLTVASNYVAGRRLSDVLDVAAAAGVIGGIDSAIGLLLELLPALSFLHSETKFAHGVLGAGRLTVTPAGSLVLLDWVFGATIEHLQFTRQRLWDELGVAAHPSAGPPRLDQASDLTQAAMIAAALVVGRPLGDNDYPGGIASLRSEIIEVAQIRGTQEFGRGMERFFDRALPIRPRRVFSSADEALFELRMVLRNSIGVDPCRAAFREFLHEAESVDPERFEIAPKLNGPSHEHRVDETPRQSSRTTEPVKVPPAASKSGSKGHRRQPAAIPVERFELERMATERVEQERRARDEAERAERLRAEAERVEQERVERERAIREAEELQRLAREKAEAERVERERAEAERRAREQAEAERRAKEKAEAEQRAREEAERKVREEIERKAREEAERKIREDAERRAREESERKAREESERKAREEAERRVREEAERKARDEAERREREAAERQARDNAERKAREDAERQARADAERRAREDAERQAREDADRKAREEAERQAREEAERNAAAEESAPEPPHIEPFDGSRRRKKDRGARGHKEKHRTTPKPSKEPERDRKQGASWLVRPDHAAASAAFDAVLPEPGEATPSDPPPASPAPTPPPVVLAPPAPPQPTDDVPTFQPIKLKPPERRATGTITRATVHAAPAPAPTLDLTDRPPYEELGGGRQIPWKPLAAAAIILMAGGYAALTMFSGSGAKPVAKRPAAAAAAPAPAPAPPPVPATTGSVEITTEPAGAKILLDGKAAGQSPLTVPNVSPGRHTVTIVGQAGTVKRTVKVEAGAAAQVDVSVFSGFAAISAPILLEVSENGRGLGTSENQIMLAPGKHDLLLTNKDLQYSTTATVDVEPGEVKQVALNPKGSANINAQPWAEVWIDGAKVGETPLANLSLPLGSREIVFRNPQFGERKVTATITAGAPANISIDLSK